MIDGRGITKTPREHFMRAAEDELAKFERKERVFRQADRDERAARLKLPVDTAAIHTRESRQGVVNKPSR